MIVNISLEINSAELKLVSHSLEFYSRHLEDRIIKGGLDEYSVKVYAAQIAGAKNMVRRITKTLYNTLDFDDKRKEQENTNG